MTVYLVRHAKAGDRTSWTGTDLDRPLSKKGRKQSAALAARLVKDRPTALLSSPYVRCTQTLEPLAELTGLPVEIDVRLEEYQPVEPLLELCRTAPLGAVLCTHGDLIPAVLEALAKSGTHVRSKRDYRKSSVWVLKRNKHGQIIHATVRPPVVV
jgi:8-oxo-dGTP diphosphatase